MDKNVVDQIQKIENDPFILIAIDIGKKTVTGLHGLPYPISEELDIGIIRNIKIPNSIIKFTAEKKIIIYNQAMYEEYCSNISSNNEMINYSEYTKEYLLLNILENIPEFENNPELYKLWKEDPEGFDDYLRGKKESEK